MFSLRAVCPQKFCKTPPCNALWGGRENFLTHNSYQESCVLNPGISVIFNVDVCISKKDRKGTKSRFSYKKTCRVDNIERGEGHSRIWVHRRAVPAGLTVGSTVTAQGSLVWERSDGRL